MKKTLTTIVMASALGLGALLGGCGNARAIANSSTCVEQKVAVSLPKNAGEPISAGICGRHYGADTEYVVCKNADGTLTMYVKQTDNKDWIQRDYQK